jgi:SAM-dependent methyltransferase
MLSAAPAEQGRQADPRKMRTPADAKKKAAATYNAASDCYDHPANFFWERYGRRTVERLRLPLGSRVLDVCCGSGASAIPTAETVGSGGFVLGVDLAENLLELARRKAKQRGLKNLDFRAGDMLDLGLPESSFDAVICVFGKDWWSMVLGTGYRGTVEQLDAEDREQVRRENIRFIRRADVRSVEANVVYAVAVRIQAGSA